VSEKLPANNRARHLGWQDVVVIDDDLSRSGSGVSRPGFERLLAAICEGRVGSLFAIEVSRLARNGRPAVNNLPKSE
jgi:DNA invertase Pin-like site-specific DNA recombinase